MAQIQCADIPALVCPLCKGFKVTPTAINECMHSFCKSCIVKYFAVQPLHIHCPVCQCELQGDALHYLRFDKGLDKLIDLFLPHVKQFEQQKEEKFNEEHGICTKIEDPQPEFDEPSTVSPSMVETADFQKEDMSTVAGKATNMQQDEVEVARTLVSMAPSIFTTEEANNVALATSSLATQRKSPLRPQENLTTVSSKAESSLPGTSVGEARVTKPKRRRVTGAAKRRQLALQASEKIAKSGMIVKDYLKSLGVEETQQNGTHVHFSMQGSDKSMQEAIAYGHVPKANGSLSPAEQARLQLSALSSTRCASRGARRGSHKVSSSPSDKPQDTKLPSGESKVPNGSFVKLQGPPLPADQLKGPSSSSTKLHSQPLLPDQPKGSNSSSIKHQDPQLPCVQLPSIPPKAEVATSSNNSAFTSQPITENHLPSSNQQPGQLSMPHPSPKTGEEKKKRRRKRKLTPSTVPAEHNQQVKSPPKKRIRKPKKAAPATPAAPETSIVRPTFTTLSMQHNISPVSSLTSLEAAPKPPVSSGIHVPRTVKPVTKTLVHSAFSVPITNNNDSTQAFPLPKASLQADIGLGDDSPGLPAFPVQERTSPAPSQPQSKKKTIRRQPVRAADLLDRHQDDTETQLIGLKLKYDNQETGLQNDGSLHESCMLPKTFVCLRVDATVLSLCNYIHRKLALDQSASVDLYFGDEQLDKTCQLGELSENLFKPQKIELTTLLYKIH